MNDEEKCHAHPPSTLLLVMGTVIMLALLFCVMSVNTCNKHLSQCREEIAAMRHMQRRTGCASKSALLSVPKELFDITVRIRTATGVGSGVIVDKDHILTNFHVIASVGQLGGTVWVDTADKKMIVCSVDRVDMARDLALIKPVDVSVVFDKWVALAKSIPVSGEALVAIGAANGNEPLATQGTFAHVTADGTYQMSLTAFWGNSGGPIFNMQGELVGLLQGVDKPVVLQGQIVVVPLHITFAVPNVWIAEFLAGR